MRKLTVYLFILFSSTALFPQDVWSGVSVATPDNLNAISTNPAGLGIQRGKQSGIYISSHPVLTTYKAHRNRGFGYNLKYEYKDGKLPNIFNPSAYNIGFGAKLSNNIYAGFKLNKEHIFDVGFLYRPLNIISLGLTVRFNDVSDNYLKPYQPQSALGIAIRPFLQHRLTIGADWGMDNDSTILSPHLALEPVDGVFLSARSNANFDDFQINLGFNFGKNTIYSSLPSNASSNFSEGIGFYSDTEQQKSIFNTKVKDTKQYIRMPLTGLFIEEKPYKPPFSFNFSFNPFKGKPKHGTQLRTWIEEIDKLAEDNDVDGLIIDIGSVRAGFAKRIEIRNALQRFKQKGKEIIIYANKGIENKDYFLIAMADKIYLNQVTGIDLKGLSMQISFIRGLLDTLSIVPEVFRVNHDGKSYKTFADPILNRTMSEEMQENYGDLLNDWYEMFVDGVSLRFDGNKEKTQGIIDNGPYWIVEEAVAAGLADSIMYPDEFSDYIKSLNNKKVKIINWKNVDRSNYYVHDWAPVKKEKIAVIYASGDIITGKSNPGPAGSSRMGDATIRKAIKSARENKDIKAIVLRINSGGGSAFASEQIWREIKKTTDIDTTNFKPFIASMSDYAASGGYEIACQADTIIASPGTVTGSIGVIGLRLNFSQLINRIGINTEWIKAGEHSDFFTGGRLVNDYEREKYQDVINHYYDRFKEHVRDGRENITASDDLDQVALGRVFSGQRALGKDIPIALIDTIGSFQDAIIIAQNAAGLEGQEIEIVEYPKPKDRFSNLFNKETDKIKTFDILKDMLPEDISEQLEILNILPIIMDDDIQMLLPYTITIE